MSSWKENWDRVQLVSEFSEQDVDVYCLEGGEFLNEYYVISAPQTRKLLNTPEIVGYEVYHCMLPSTTRMMSYLEEQGKITNANILSILRGALNYPLEESCYRDHIRVHDISFLSSEKVFDHDEVAGLEIKYSKLTMVSGGTLLLGDIIASGETLRRCMRYVTDFYRQNGGSLRNIVIFAIGGTRGIALLETLTQEIREYWPAFEGFITVFYEGIFSTCEDKGLSGLNSPNMDFSWKGGIISPKFRQATFAVRESLFEKSVICGGGKRRYEIQAHVHEVLSYWEGLEKCADTITLMSLLEEKLGYPLPIAYEDWLGINHYRRLGSEEAMWLYKQEKGYVESLADVSLGEIAAFRKKQFEEAVRQYIL